MRGRFASTWNSDFYHGAMTARVRFVHFNCPLVCFVRLACVKTKAHAHGSVKKSGLCLFKTTFERGQNYRGYVKRKHREAYNVRPLARASIRFKLGRRAFGERHANGILNAAKLRARRVAARNSRGKKKEQPEIFRDANYTRAKPITRSRRCHK